MFLFGLLGFVLWGEDTVLPTSSSCSLAFKPNSAPEQRVPKSEQIWTPAASITSDFPEPPTKHIFFPKCEKSYPACPILPSRNHLTPLLPAIPALGLRSHLFLLGAMLVSSYTPKAIALLHLPCLLLCTAPSFCLRHSLFFFFACYFLFSPNKDLSIKNRDDFKHLQVE